MLNFGVSQQTASSSAGEEKSLLFLHDPACTFLYVFKSASLALQKSITTSTTATKLLLLPLCCDTTTIALTILVCGLCRQCNVGISAPPHKRHFQSLGVIPKQHSNRNCLRFASVLAGKPCPCSRRIRQHQRVRIRGGTGLR